MKTERDMYSKGEGWSWGRGLFLRDIPIAVESPRGPRSVGGGGCREPGKGRGADSGVT